MPRNLDRRVELMVSIADEASAERLKRILRTSLDDTEQAWRLLPDGRYVRRRSEEEKIA